MQRRLLDILICIHCGGELTCFDESDHIADSRLVCNRCEHAFPVINGIPRFVKAENYASSFGYQWNRFRKEQIDSFNGTTLSADRLWSETGWNREELKSKWVLDAGCGAGRFLDAASKSEAEIVGVDISNAIDAAKENLKGRTNVHLVQASIYEMPFRDGLFDFAYCIGVVQHTPQPQRALSSIARVVKPGGSLAVTIYPRKPWTKLFSKYWLRPITKRMKKERLLKVIEKLMPIAFPLTNVLFRVPVLGKVFMFLVPIANYVHENQLSRDQRYAWAILDTFDMLSPYYDQPMTENEAVEPLRAEGVSVQRTSQRGLNLVGKKD
jgi:ubiquinone/menaquinone biosynthesis C-methylase UbiE/uncharacterized protein YbaR (Trm112 family)